MLNSKLFLFNCETKPFESKLIAEHGAFYSLRYMSK